MADQKRPKTPSERTDDDGLTDVDDGEEQAKIGARLKEAREYVGLLQEDVASALGIPRASVSALESGKRRVTGLEVRRLARIYRRPVGWLLGEEDVELTEAEPLFRAAEVALRTRPRPSAAFRRVPRGRRQARGIRKSRCPSPRPPSRSAGHRRRDRILMPANGNAWQRSLQAAESAGRLLDELGVEQTRQVDVFSMCEDLELWLAFLPMDGLLGAFVPEGTGGVLITDRRPITVQRYTAAHELGHWRLEHGHGLALDGEEHVFGASPAERERLAQMFAANLLMPPPLVLSLLTRIGVGDHGPVRPDQAYFVAREAGVSYEAAVRQLTNLQVITAADATALLGVRPLTVKSQLAGGRRPVYGYADVWPVDEQWNDQLVSLRADDEVVVSLPENRSTGYRWMFDDEVVDVTPAPEPPPMGDPHPLPLTLAPSSRFLDAARTTRRGRAPGAALDRARRLHPEPSAPDASAERILHGGAAVVGDDYLPGRTPKLRANDARRAASALAAGETSTVGDLRGRDERRHRSGRDAGTIRHRRR